MNPICVTDPTSRKRHGDGIPTQMNRCSRNMKAWRDDGKPNQSPRFLFDDKSHAAMGLVYGMFLDGGFPERRNVR